MRISWAKFFYNQHKKATIKKTSKSSSKLNFKIVYLQIKKITFSGFFFFLSKTQKQIEAVLFV